MRFTRSTWLVQINHGSIEPRFPKKSKTGATLPIFSLLGSLAWYSCSWGNKHGRAMQLKYADELGRYENCPPANVSPRSGEAFRFVHADAADTRNFMVVSRLNPARLPHLPDAVCCSSFALSLFSKKEKAIEFFGKLKNKNRNIHKSLGTHLATVTIDENDGHATADSVEGHFSLYESHSADLSKKCRNREVLP